jgi:hypothetical protein
MGTCSATRTLLVSRRHGAVRGPKEERSMRPKADKRQQNVRHTLAEQLMNVFATMFRQRHTVKDSGTAAFCGAACCAHKELQYSQRLSPAVN